MVREAVVIIWVICWLVIVLGQDYHNTVGGRGGYTWCPYVSFCHPPLVCWEGDILRQEIFETLLCLRRWAQVSYLWIWNWPSFPKSPVSSFLSPSVRGSLEACSFQVIWLKMFNVPSHRLLFWAGPSKLAFIWTLTSHAAVLYSWEAEAGQLLCSWRCRKEVGHSWTDLVPLSEGGALMKLSCIRDWEQWVEYLLGDKLRVTSLSVLGRWEVMFISVSQWRLRNCLHS